MLAGLLNNFQQFQVFYTVHDLAPHDVKLNFFRRIKHYYFRIRKDKMLIEQVPNLVTNNLKQLGQLKRLYPEKRIVFHQMPGLVTPGIKAGEKKIGELGSTTDYILFFGRIEFYKGVEHLYNLFINNGQLTDQILVIAGSGNIYFKRYFQREKNVIFINRYIEEQEINDLFSKARFMVLPYLSATQSAVTSLGYHYHLPVVGSDIDGIKDTIIHKKTGLIYDHEVQDALNNSILTLLNDVALRRQIQKNLQNVYYLYDQNELKNQINRIYLD
jgi:glycosyltransferase involved in cell wall biosynthesis